MCLVFITDHFFIYSPWIVSKVFLTLSFSLVTPSLVPIVIGAHRTSLLFGTASAFWVYPPRQTSPAPLPQCLRAWRQTSEVTLGVSV